MIKRIIMPGPPGTGKTYRLVNTYLKEEVEKENMIEYWEIEGRLEFSRAFWAPLNIEGVSEA